MHGSGDPRARLMVVALGPDAASDAAGQPFQGEVGALLDRMLSAMGTSRAHSWLTYLTQCRSAEVGDDAIRTCTPYLRTQVELVRPAVMLLCGERTARFLLRSQAPLAELRGQWSSVLGMNAIATHDLEDLLRQPALKREAWADLQRAMQRLGTAPPQR